MKANLLNFNDLSDGDFVVAVHNEVFLKNVSDWYIENKTWFTTTNRESINQNLEQIYESLHTENLNQASPFHWNSYMKEVYTKLFPTAKFMKVKVSIVKN